MKEQRFYFFCLIVSYMAVLGLEQRVSTKLFLVLTVLCLIIYLYNRFNQANNEKFSFYILLLTVFAYMVSLTISIPKYL